MQKLIKIIIDCSKGYEVYAVGGFVRDLFFKRILNDMDLAVNKDAKKFAKKIAKALNAKLVILDDINKIYRIILKNNDVKNIDISLFDGKSIEEDLKNRDFTVNAIAFPLCHPELVSKSSLRPPSRNLIQTAGLRGKPAMTTTVQNGAFLAKTHFIIFADKKCLQDLKNKTINILSKNVFKKDSLRMLRAFRFASEFNFKISAETLEQIKTDSDLINKSAAERVKNEFFRILASGESAKYLKIMDNCGLLTAMFPEVYKMKKAVKKYYYHPDGLFQHSFETMEAVENILNNLKKYFPDNYKELEAHFSNAENYSEYVTKGNLLKFAALFHDSAKPETAKKEGGKMRFFGHEEQGAGKIEEIAQSLKMSKKDAANAKFLIENHMRPSTLTKNNIVTNKAALKFLRDIGDNTPDLLILSMADWHSYKKLKVFSPKELKMQENSVRGLISQYYEIKNAKPLPKLIDGNIIMKEFKLKPGPWLGDLLNYVIEAQQEGKISDKQSALKLLLSKLASVKKKYKL